MNFRFRCAICTISHKTRQTTTFIYEYFVRFSFTVPIPTLPPPPRDFPRPDIIVNCLADGVSVSVKVADPNFHGVMYVKGHAQSTECRRNVEQGEAAEPLDFSVKFDTCGLFHSDVSYLAAHIVFWREKSRIKQLPVRKSISGARNLFAEICVICKKTLQIITIKAFRMNFCVQCTAEIVIKNNLLLTRFIIIYLEHFNVIY